MRENYGEKEKEWPTARVIYWWSKIQQITITGQLSGRLFIGPMACAIAITNSEPATVNYPITPCIKMHHYDDMLNI